MEDKPRQHWRMSKEELIKAMEGHVGLKAVELQPEPASEEPNGPPAFSWDAEIEFRSPNGAVLIRVDLGDRGDGTWFIASGPATPALNNMPDGLNPANPRDYLDQPF